MVIAMTDKSIKQMKRLYMTGSVIMVWLLLVLMSFQTAEAQERLQESDTQLVILLDCSQSMEDVDSQYVIPDFIKEISATAPESYRIGVVAFDEEICFALPLGSSYEEIEDALENVAYSRYGNAGDGLAEAVALLQDEDGNRKIMMISDGEIMMKREEETAESVQRFADAVNLAKEEKIVIDIVALGERVEEGGTIYAASDETGGEIHDFADSGELEGFLEQHLLDAWGIKRSHVGTMNGKSGELSIPLPDCCMERMKIYLLGNQENENLNVNVKAAKMHLLKGKNYTVIEIDRPESEDINIRMSSIETMDVMAYLSAQYHLQLSASSAYLPETGATAFYVSVENPTGQNLLEGHLSDSRLKVFLNGKAHEYRIESGKIYLEEMIAESATITLSIDPYDLFGDYYGDMSVTQQVVIPEPEEEPEQIDWFFWSVIGIFIVALFTVFFLAFRRKKTRPMRRKMIDDSRVMPRENVMQRNDFSGKIQVYVLHSRNDIDYPPESINLFARCNRDMITLEWVLDACNLPLQLQGAEKVIIRPGADKSLVIKNNSKASALMGRELLRKGHSYHLYYHQKVTFIFDQEDTEIEVHYKDLKPNER